MNHGVMREGPQSSRRHFVPLDTPPEHFRIPEDLHARFGYDVTRKGLTFEGWMCKVTFDRLRGISSDYHYQRALERLFQIAVPEEDSTPRTGLGVLVAAGVALLAVVAVCGLLFWHP